MRRISRRRFVKGATAAGAALTAFPTLLVQKAPAAWARKTTVHPEVDNLRVVGLTDAKMTKSLETGISWARQNELVVEEVFWANIDRLARALTQAQEIPVSRDFVILASVR